MKSYEIKKIFRRSISTLLVIFLLLGNSISVSAANEDERNLQYFQSIIDMVREQYKGDLTDSQLLEGAVKGILNSLDDYTTYYTHEETDSFMGTITGTFGGIGVSMEISGDYIIVSKVFPASPAEKAGLLQGDKIVEADGNNLIKATPDQAAAIIKGDVGTKVKLGILRNGASEVKYIEVSRDIIKINPVTYEIRDGIGYIKLELFNENTKEFFAKALTEMDNNKVTKIILDLRDNPGGEVTQAVAVAQRFVPRGLITKLDYKSERYFDMKYYSYVDEPKYKLAVLVNGMSASASEIVTGAIQDTGAGKLIGTKTFGKAKFQGLLPILTPEAFSKYEQQYGIRAVNGYDLQDYGIYPAIDEIAGYTKMTLGLYYTPKGRMIDGTGLIPDIVIEDPEPVSGIYINGIQKLTNTTEPGLNAQGIDVYNAKKVLRVLNYKVSTMDTTLDADTVKILKVYQKNNGLNASGILDYKTQNSMNINLLNIIAKYDKQYAAAVKYLNENE